MGASNEKGEFRDGGRFKPVQEFILGTQPMTQGHFAYVQLSSFLRVETSSVAAAIHTRGNEVVTVQMERKGQIQDKYGKVNQKDLFIKTDFQLEKLSEYRKWSIVCQQEFPTGKCIFYISQDAVWVPKQNRWPNQTE